MMHLPLVPKMTCLVILLFPFFKYVNSYEFGQETNCSITQDKFSQNSPFHQNLKIVLANLTSAASKTNSGFYNSTYGNNENIVYGLHLCRGDITSPECSLCIGNAIERITEVCPDNKEAIIWADVCMLRYANRNIFSKEEEDPSTRAISYMAPAPPVGQPVPPVTPPPPPKGPTFNISEVVLRLINETAFGSYSLPATPRYYLTREDNITDSWYDEVLYSLAQCTPDLDALQCHKCLTKAFSKAECCWSTATTIVYLPSCNIRIAQKKFFHSKLTIQNDLPPLTSPLSSTITPPQSDNSKRRSSYIPIAIVVPSVMATVLLIGFGLFLWKRNAELADETINMESLKYDIATIDVATNGFCAENKIGEGRFGVVYKGRLNTGKEIAVKKLSKISWQGIKKFKNEFLLVAKLQHKNLTKIMGYCVTKEEIFLIYEFMPNSSLDKVINDTNGDIILGWKTRYKIIEGIAKGLLYLHEYSQYKIVHGNLKLRNILIDKDMTPKISDIGMTKLFGEDYTKSTQTKLIEPHEHMAPEYIRGGELSIKSDVYSFGLLVLEIVSGQSRRYTSVLQNAWRLSNDQEPLAFVDSKLHGNFSADEAIRCIDIGLSCIQEDTTKRPTMAYIVSILNNHSNNLPEISLESQHSSDRHSSEVLRQSNSTYSGTQYITVLSAR